MLSSRKPASYSLRINEKAQIAWVPTTIMHRIKLKPVSSTAPLDLPTTITNTIQLLTDTETHPKLVPTSQTRSSLTTSYGSVPKSSIPTVGALSNATISQPTSRSTPPPITTSSELHTTSTAAAPIPTHSTSKSHGSNYQKVILGSILGGVLGLGFCAVLVFCSLNFCGWMRRRKSRRREDTLDYRLSSLGTTEPLEKIFNVRSSPNGSYTWYSRNKMLDPDESIPVLSSPQEFEKSPFNSHDLLHLNHWVPPRIPPKSATRFSKRDPQPFHTDPSEDAVLSPVRPLFEDEIKPERNSPVARVADTGDTFPSGVSPSSSVYTPYENSTEPFSRTNSRRTTSQQHAETRNPPWSLYDNQNQHVVYSDPAFDRSSAAKPTPQNYEQHGLAVNLSVGNMHNLSRASPNSGSSETGESALTREPTYADYLSFVKEYDQGSAVDHPK